MFDKTSEPFSVRAKQFWDVSEARMVTTINEVFPLLFCSHTSKGTRTIYS